ncbi:MAG TPA: acetate/propionate family kinase, partial [Actinomycetota bacterium]
VGENAPVVRERAAEGLAFLGVEIDAAKNLAAGDREIGANDAPVRTLVIEAREDLQMAREIRHVLPRRA